MSIHITPAIPAAAIPVVAVPEPTCMCCWYTLNPVKPFPESWSSTVCEPHANWLLSRRRSRPRTAVEQKAQAAQ